MTERDIFTAAREKTDPAARSAYLAGECAENPALRARVEALLRAHDRADSLLDDLLVGPVGADRPPDDGPTRTHREESADDDRAGALAFLAPPGRPDSLGRIGHYEVLEVLGQGGFGVVFRAFDEVLQRVVAVKVLAPSLAVTSPARKRFLREARSAAPIQHENVVRIHEVGEQPLPHLVMEFVPGETLQQRLDRTGPLEVAEALRIGRQVADGLAAAHATGLIHRDIKPSNILLDDGPHGRVKITDFGLARAADDASLTRSGVVAGTPMYMAPEQARGESLDHRADLFSLGSVLYATLTGRPPFRATATLAVLKRVAEDTPRPIREVIPEVPEWLCRIVEKLHAKRPEDRFQSAKEVAEVLADCEAQLKAHREVKDFARIPEAKPAPRRPRRSRWVAMACVLPLLAGAFVVAATSPSIVAWVRNLGGRHQSQAEPGVLELRLSDTAMLFRVDDHWPAQTAIAVMQIPLEAGEHSVWFSLGGREFRTAPFHIAAGEQAELDLTVTPEGGVAQWKSQPLAVVTLTGLPSADGFVPLFNGKDLTGWKTHPSQPGDWKVVDGAITCSGPRSHLFSERGDFRDFQLRVFAQINDEGDSGVFFRSPFVSPDVANLGNAANFGYEANIYAGTALPDIQTGTLFHIPSRQARVSDRLTSPNKEFLLEIIARGPRLITRVNGKTTVDVVDPRRLFDEGHIALQHLNPKTTVRFRKIEVKELPPGKPDAPPPPAVAPFDATRAREIQETWARHLGIPVEDTNSIGMKLRLIPPGRFAMGSPDDEPGRAANEGPQHDVTVSQPFYVGAHHVTVGQFRAFVKATSYRTDAENSPQGGSGLVDGKWVFDRGTNWQNPGFVQSDENPVTCVSWNDAQAFCDWLSEKEGRRYALPSEAQWEYACRAGSLAKYHFGGDDGQLGEYAWYTANSDGRAHAVGKKKPSAWGLYDMHGNAWQWTADRYDADASRAVPGGGPPGPKTDRVARGGSWFDAAERTRSAHRGHFPESWTETHVGFRVVVLDPKPTAPPPPPAPPEVVPPPRPKS